jgi:DNA-binding phage protein
MDCELLAAELARALRGRRSQPALSRRLGFTSNVVYAWESGRRAAAASVFFRLVALGKVDVAAMLAGFAGDGALRGLDFSRPSAIAQLLRALRADRPLSEIARAVAVDRTTVARWFDAVTEPRLPELLRYVDATTQRLLEFVSLFADPSALGSTRKRYADLLAQRRLAYELPWSHAVLRALELDAYRALPRHEPGFLARCVGISREDETRCLRALAAAKQIALEHGHYKVKRVLTVDTRPNEEENRRLKLHWASVGLQRLQAGAPPGALFSYNLFPIDARGFERIRRLHLEYYERIREIVAESSAADRVVLMNMQLVPLESEP